MSTQISSSIDQFRARGLLILHDDFASPYRGVLVAAAQEISEERVNEAITLATGICFVAVSRTRAEELLLAQMKRPEKRLTRVSESSAPLAMALSVEAREGVSTGISAADRATTIRVLGEPVASPRRLVHPGHIFPVETRDGGVLVKNSLPEGALDLVQSAGYSDAALFIDLLSSAGELLSPEAQRHLADQHQIPFVTLSELVQHRLLREPLVKRVADARLPTFFAGELRSIIYKSLIGDGEHLALVKGTPSNDTPTIVRVQTEFTFSDVFGGNQPPSRHQIQAALSQIHTHESGVLLYLRRSSHGSLRDQILKSGTPFVPKSASMMREYGLGAQILRDLGIRKALILSNSPATIVGLDSFGIEIVGYRPLEPGTSSQQSSHEQ